MIDCEKCIYRKNGGCGYENEGCNYIPIGVPAIPISVIEGIKGDIDTEIMITLDQLSLRHIDYSDGYISALRQALKFIDKRIKEYTE